MAKTTAAKATPAKPAAAKSRSFGFGIIGCGMIANFHAKAIGDIRGARVVACYDAMPAAADRFAAAHAGCKAYHKLDELLADAEVDGCRCVVVAAGAVIVAGPACCGDLSVPSLLRNSSIAPTTRTATSAMMPRISAAFLR